MLLRMLKGKIHRAVISAVEPDYEGSCAIDESLLAAAGIIPHEAVEIYNVNNGERLSTYAIPATAGSGTVSLNGAAARKALVGDTVIIAAYCLLDADSEALTHTPSVVMPVKNLLP